LGVVRRGVVVIVIRRVKVLEHERALVFRNGALEEVLQPGVHWRLDPFLRLQVGRLELVLKPGVYALWTALRDVRVDVLDARGALFQHEQLAAVLALPGTAALLEPLAVEAGHVGLLFRDGRHEATLARGRTRSGGASRG
jgi:hypothetical protein